MLHATRPPPHAWPVMSQPGPDLLIHHPHQPHGTRNGAHPSQGDHLKTDTTMGHQIDAPTHHPGTSTVFNNVNSFYNPHHTGFNIFPPSSYTVHHPASRPSSREPEGQGSLRHPSGGSVTGGSGGSHTPPSPEENRQNTNPMPSYKQSVIMDRNSTARTSFEQRQCNSAGSENQTQGVTQGSPAPGNGSAPHTPYRMQPPSPANSNMPQKSPFDMTTMGLSKSIENYSSTHSIIAHSPGTTASAFSSSGRPGSVISSVRMPASPYQSSVNIKQEPGSPAQYAPANLANRAVKQEPPNQPSPNSPRTVNATPPPSQTHPHGYPQSMERKLIQNRIPHGTQGFNFPSPQPHGGNSHPISPAANIGDTNPRPVNKFRYPSGPQPVQNLSPGESNSNSAMSSREGTPGPTRQSWCGEESSGPAPNVDISSVQVKEEFGLGLMRYEPSNSLGNDYSRRPSINLSYPAATTSVSSHIDSYSSHPGYGTYHHAMPQQVALPPRSFHPMRPGSVHPGLHGSGIPGRPLSLPGNSESSSHSNVKIGRRPAHLPKVLKFSDNTLPHGWVRKLKQRKHGKQAGRWDVYIYSPCGVKFASRKKLRNFFEKNNLQYDPEDFDFTPYGRHIEQSAHARHHSSNENVHRHVGSSGSPSSVSSPSSSYNSPGIHPEFKSEFLSPPTPNPPTAHRPHSYIHPHQPPMFSDYNPMMESPPNANALEVPQHQILNLSQPQPITNSISRASSTPILATSHPAPVSNFPPDIATILNEPSDNQFRQSLREYQNDLSSRHPPVEPMANNSTDDSMHVDESGNMDDKKEAMGEDNRFMTRTYNLLTASQGDLGDMMDEYSIYPE